MKNHLIAATAVLTACTLAAVGGMYFQTMEMKERMVSVEQSLQALSADNNREVPAADLEAVVAAGVQRHLEAQKAAKVAEKYEDYAAAREGIPGEDRVYGSLDARFTLVTYSDLECPYCKRFHNTPKDIVDGADGLVNWQWKHMPLGFHNPVAHDDAQAAECVADQKGSRGFWVFLKEIFTHSQGNGGGVPDLEVLAEGVGADRALFRECLSSGQYADRVTEQAQ